MPSPSFSKRKLRLERLEDRRVLAAATFSEVSAAIGLDGLRGGSGEFHGGGLTFTDLNEDGYADLYLIGPSSRGNRVYVNVDDGAGGRTFERLPNNGGAPYSLGNSIGAVAADYDNDGDLDIYLANYRGPNILYRNMWREDHPDGVGDPLDLRLVDVTPLTDPTLLNPPGDTQHGLAAATYQNPDPAFGNDTLDNTMSAAWADVNRDGWVDLFVGSWDGTNGDPNTGEDGQLGERDTLYLNNGDGTFTDVTMGPEGSTPALPLLDDGSFEAAEFGSTTSNSDWALTGDALFQLAPWVSSEGSIGVWFRGFGGSPGDPGAATLTQTVTAADAGEYTLRFDTRVEANFPTHVGDFRATISSSGTGGSETIDLIAASPNTQYNTHTLSLEGVSAGDSLTITVEMTGATGAGEFQVSAMTDAFFLQGPGESEAWEQVGGWAYADGSINDPSLPAEFSGQNGLQFADFNNDGWQDLIIATMGGGGVAPNRDMLYINRGVNAEGDWLGYRLVSYDIGFGGNESSDMGVAVADIDNDGDLDYFSTILPDDHPLWINNLSDTGELGFTQTTITNTFSWGANFHDFDNNGRVDLLVGTEVDRPSFLHLQDLDGTLTEQAAAAGLTSTHSTRGVAVADFDRDGASDAALWAWNGNNPGIQLYHNETPTLGAGHRYLTLELEGDPTLPGQFKSTRDAIGARAYVTADFDGDGTIESDETRIEEVLSGHSNGATTSSLALEFGLGLADRADVVIAWGSGRTSTLRGVAADQFVAVKESATDIDVLIGDYNGDRTVDAADYSMWRDTAGTLVAPFTGADGDGDGAVWTNDHAAWAANYGLTAPPVAPPALATASAPDEPSVPAEPAGEALAADLQDDQPAAFIAPVDASSNRVSASDASPDRFEAVVDAALLLLIDPVGGGEASPAGSTSIAEETERAGDQIDLRFAGFADRDGLGGL